MTVKRKKLVSVDAAVSELRALVTMSGMTQTAFARKHGDSPEALCQTLRGKRGLSRRMQRRLGLRRVVAYEPHAAR